jgi:type II secretory pathway pseudopilin PulG
MQGNRARTLSRETGVAGFTLVEVLLVCWVLLIALGSVVAVVTSSQRLARTNEETSIAYAAARQRMAELQSVPFQEIFARYNGAPNDDPGAPGSAPGKDFAVRGLSAALDDADGFVGEVVFPELPIGGGLSELREDVVLPSLGMPRDLNGDGAPPDALNHAGDYVILPVTIQVRWRGAAGTSVFTLDQVLYP